MSYYLKALLWYNFGTKHFTKLGFERNARNFESFENINVKGWSFMVTGGSSGIGKATALYLSKKQGTIVHIVCRNPENGENALQEIRKEAHPDSQVTLHIVDLSDPMSVVKFSTKFINDGIKLNVLINNAGYLAGKLVLAECGLDNSFLLNVIGTYLLTTKLLNHLVSCSENLCKPRVIVVSSGGMLTKDLNYDDPSHINRNYDGVDAYAQHKRQQVVIVDALSDRYPAVHFSSMHPGWVDTPGVEQSLSRFYKSQQGKLRTPLQGADTIIWLATSPEALKISSGEFFFDRVVANRFVISSSKRYKKEIENKFMKNLDEIVKKVTE